MTERRAHLENKRDELLNALEPVMQELSQLDLMIAVAPAKPACVLVDDEDSRG